MVCYIKDILLFLKDIVMLVGTPYQVILCLSTTGYVFTIGGGAISWKSKKQQIIAKSTMEAKLIALSSASEEAGWLRDLLYEIPM